MRNINTISNQMPWNLNVALLNIQGNAKYLELYQEISTSKLTNICGNCDIFLQRVLFERFFIV